MANHPLPGDVHQTIAEWLAAGREFALAVVLRDSGSTPRKAGTKAIIDATGAIWGTIGGGLLESQAQALAVQALAAQRAAVFEFRFAGRSAGGCDPICGGKMQVLIDPSVRRHAAYAEAAQSLRCRQRGVLVTTVNGGDLREVEVRWFPLTALPADLPDADAIRQAVETQTPQSFTAPTPSGAADGLAEPLVPPPLLLIEGGGHVGQALAQQASLVGFDVVVADDRPEYADEARYPPNVTVRRRAFPEVLDEFPPGPDTYIALVGRGHPVDMTALAACIGKPVAYLGMMGSRRKVALVRKELIATGQATEQQFDRVCAPIGMHIGAQTVPEIAASIVAQLVAVRRTGRPDASDWTSPP